MVASCSFASVIMQVNADQAVLLLFYFGSVSCWGEV